ncbi:hypothetical protein HGM15179_021708 [Zosterops borbonicus]|uniref:CCHC-type domain-containing protein n=1 Tax=Zosterops borbonicus TaxID=364589 RepID=A0A8K1D3Y9_9PASS|nr:hypothetical protein HGM15179_021708 [Zosterops borbonicus]
MLSAGGHSKYLATQIRSGCPSGVSIKGGLRLGPTGPKKHTPAAKKMGYLAADCYPVGEGKGRGVFWWKVLIVLSLVLSLVLSQVGGFHPENPQRLTPMEECKPCLEVTQKGQATTRNLKYQTHYDCQEDKKKEYCFFNGTQYQVCESEKGVVCHDPRAITKDGQSKAHEIYKQEAGKMPTIPVCDRCNRTVWIGGRKKFTFLGYYQINRLFYDKNKLEMCTTGGKMYWFLDRLQTQVERQVQDSMVQAELIKEMAQRNVSETCRRIILSLPLEPAPSLAHMIEACTRKAEFFNAPERNAGLAQPKTAAVAGPGPRKQPLSVEQLQGIICLRCKKPGHFAIACPQNQKQKKVNKQKN